MAFVDNSNPAIIACIAPSDGVNVGDMLLIGTRVVLALSTARAGYSFPAYMRGPVAQAPAAAEVWVAGDELGWDDTNKVLTTALTGNTPCGYATSGKTASAAVGNMTLVDAGDSAAATHAAEASDSANAAAASASDASDSADAAAASAATIDLTAPGPIGGTTPAAGKFTTLQCTSALKLDNAYAAGVVVCAGSLTVKDSTGTVYKLLCLPAV